MAREVYPLEKLPAEKQAEIARLVAQPTPPPKYIRIAGGMAEIQSRAWFEWYLQRGIDPDRIREKIPAWMRDTVIHRDGHVCHICGGDVPEDDVHLDHVHPVSLGGRNELDNLRVAHSRCNMRKGART